MIELVIKICIDVNKLFLINICMMFNYFKIKKKFRKKIGNIEFS